MSFAVDKIYTRTLQAASELFFSYGYSRVSMDEVAKSLGMSKKTIYKHFGSKQELLLATMKQYYDEIQVGVDRLHEDTNLDHANRLRMFIELLGQKMGGIRRAQMDLRQGAPEVWDYVEERREQVVFSELRGLINTGIKNDELRADIDPELLGSLVTIWIQAVANSDVMTEYPVSAADLLQTMLNVLMDGMRLPPK